MHINLATSDYINARARSAIQLLPSHSKTINRTG